MNQNKQDRCELHQRRIVKIRRENQRRRARRRRQYVMTFLVILVIIAGVLAVAEMFFRQNNNPRTDPNTSLAMAETDEQSATIEESETLVQSETQPEEEQLPWYLTLVNRWHPLPQGHNPKLVQVEGGEMVDQRIYEPLQELLDAAKAQGYIPIVVSGYRTPEKQQQIYDEKIASFTALGYGAEDAKALAEEWVAIPGTSEHQLGLAVDINGDVYDLYTWLQNNSYKYGFVLRYPGDKSDITGVSHEEWHFRYVGVEAATQMHEQGLCLEEYLNETE